MKKSKLKYLLTCLTTTMVMAISSGCASKSEADTVEPLIGYEITNSEIPSETIEQEDKEIISTEIVYSETEFLSLLSDYYESLINTGNVSELLKKDDLFKSASLYLKLKNRGITNEEILNDLHNVLVFGLSYECMDEAQWNYLFGNLMKVENERTNVLEKYYVLAKTMHMFCCENNHENYHRITCQDIEDKYNSIDYNELFWKSLPIENCHSKVAISSYQRLNKINFDYEKVLEELELYYRLAQTPTCLSEEILDTYLPILNSSIEERESMYDLYYDLAVYVHEYMCEYIHEKNEYGASICTKKLK